MSTHQQDDEIANESTLSALAFIAAAVLSAVVLLIAHRLAWV